MMKYILTITIFFLGLYLFGQKLDSNIIVLDFHLEDSVKIEKRHISNKQHVSIIVQFDDRWHNRHSRKNQKRFFATIVNSLYFENIDTLMVDCYYSNAILDFTGVINNCKNVRNLKLLSSERMRIGAITNSGAKIDNLELMIGKKGGINVSTIDNLKVKVLRFLKSSNIKFKGTMNNEISVETDFEVSKRFVSSLIKHCKNLQRISFNCDLQYYRSLPKATNWR